MKGFNYWILLIGATLLVFFLLIASYTLILEEQNASISNVTGLIFNGIALAVNVICLQASFLYGVLYYIAMY